MRMFIALAFACGLVVAANAQDTKTTTTTKVSGGEVKSVTYTGCVETGTEAKSFILDKIVPTSRTTTTEAVGTSGTVTTTTTYELVPSEKVEIQTHLGHKVEVTGMMMPAGEIRTESSTKIDRDDAKDTVTRETTKTKNAMPRFQVTSIRNLADSCTP